MRRLIPVALILLGFSAFSLRATDRFVRLDSPNPAPPYTNWDTAAHQIQDAIDAADPGDTVLVTNGLYNTGGRVAFDPLTNRIAITKSLTVQSVNGPTVTIIEGHQTPGITNGNDSMRCVYMTNDTTLIGFTITHGSTYTNIESGYGLFAGGVFCENWTNSVLSNCVIIANSSSSAAGGVRYGTLNNCLVASNSSFEGGGAFWTSMNHCVVIGNSIAPGTGTFSNSYGPGAGVYGAYYTAIDNGLPPATLKNCTLIGNSAAAGADQCVLENCILTGNTFAGTSACRMLNCTVVSNSIGVLASFATNCIIYYNTNGDYDPNGRDGYGYLVNCCVGPVSGFDPEFKLAVFRDEPLFVNLPAGDFRLASTSPCINSGSHTDFGLTNDFDGNPRIVGGTADVGAYEFQGNVRYVSLSSTNPLPPYSDWSIAATNIQDAIDAADPGDTVLVTNGVYNTGGRVVYDTLTNRIAITKALTVQSVNGPAVTTIEGYQLPGTTNGTGAVRCVYMTNNTTLIGFTITHGATDTNEGFGGGVLCENFTNSVLSNCVIIANSALYGGGVYQGTLNDCLIASNSVVIQGGGVYYSTLYRCVVKGNYAAFGTAGIVGNWSEDEYWTSANYCTIIGNSTPNGGGGAGGAVLNNCILIGNQAADGGGAISCRLYSCTVVSNSAAVGAGVEFCGTLNSIIYYNNGPNIDHDQPSGPQGFTEYSCTALPPYPEAGNFTNEPSFVNIAAGDFHLQPNSPCINSGNNSLLTVTNNFTSNPDHAYLTFITSDFDGNPRTVGGTVDVGAYEFQGNVRYVSLSSTNPVPPYSDWSIAATNIQDAIDAANPGDTVLVSNGVYNTGGRVVYDTLTNRIAITKPLTVQSVNGPAVTTIEGYQLPGITNGTGAVRCVWMTNNTTLIGFTITHGATEGTNSDSLYDPFSGGVYCENYTNSVLSNCVIIANSALQDGGVSFGTLNDCLIASNSATEIAGGVAFSTLNRCVIKGNYAGWYGAGAVGNWNYPWNDGYCCSLNDCTLIGNWTTNHSGGAYEEILNNCILTGNQAASGGGGAGACSLYNCTVVSNSAPVGAGVDWCTTRNSIVYYNNGPNIDGDLTPDSFTAYTCTPDPRSSGGNFTNEPLFVNPAAGDYHLQPNSPCINSGNNSLLTITNNLRFFPDDAYLTFFTNDFDGNPRVVGGTVDVGAYEIQSPTSVISYAWLQKYGFPIDGSADSADPDGDGMNNWQEWRAGTIPTDPASLLQMLVPTIGISGVNVSWQSQTNTIYFLQRSSDLSTPFSTIQSNLVGQTGATSCIDTNAVGAGPFFYRIGVQ